MPEGNDAWARLAEGRYRGMPGRYPGSARIIPDHLSEDAHSCFEAACGRNVEIGTELKTIVLYLRDIRRMAIFNLPGNEELDLKRLGIPGVRFAMEKDGFPLSAGCINPFNTLWVCQNPVYFVSTSVMASTKRFTTNNGTLRGTMVLTAEVIMQSVHGVHEFSATCESIGRRRKL